MFSVKYSAIPAALICIAIAGKALSAVADAKNEFARIRQEARAARTAGDKPARVEAILRLQRFMHDSADAVETAAQAYADAGENEKALAALRQFAEMGQVDDELLKPSNKSFAAIEQRPEYKAILQRFGENKAPISQAETAFALPDAGLIAEDIDYDPHSRTFLITSVLEKKIIRLNSEGKVADFAESPSHWPMLAVKIDSGRKLVWATEVALDSFTAAPKSDWGRSAVLCFDLQTGMLRNRIEGPAKSALGDMVLSREGDPIVSDGDGGGVYLVHNGQLQRIDAGEFVSPQTSALDPEGNRLFIPDYVRGIGVMDLASKQVTFLEAQGKYALEGIDGLYFDNRWLIATQNGTSPERVIRFELEPTRTKIISQQVIERATYTLGDPTHGVVVGDSFYYIANSGWSELDEHGNVKPGSKLTSACIMRFPLHGVSERKAQ